MSAAAPESWGRRWSWLPLPIAFTIILVLHFLDTGIVHDSPVLLAALNLAFSTTASLAVACLCARSFLGNAETGLLLCGSGMLVWGLGSGLGAICAGRSVNLAITIHNSSVLIAGACHLAGGMLARQQRTLRQPAIWLAAAYVSALALVALVAVAAALGGPPLFFVQGRGGTPVRQCVLGTGVLLFALTAWLLWRAYCRKSSDFLWWYALGLALLATGLTGVLIQRAHGSLSGWAGRAAQYAGGLYLLLAALAPLRETGGWRLSLNDLVRHEMDSGWAQVLRRHPRLRGILRYGAAFLAVLLASGSRDVLDALAGGPISPFLPAICMTMLVALLCGLGPGLVATICSAAWAVGDVLPPAGQFAAAAPSHRIALWTYIVVGILISGIMELYRRTRAEVSLCARERALGESQARLAAFAEATFDGIVLSEAGRIVDCNEQFAQMAGTTVEDVRGRTIDEFLAPEDRERVLANIRANRESFCDHVMLRRDGTRIFAGTHGRPVAPGGTWRHTAVRDITAHRKAEEALRASEARLQSLADNVPSILMRYDRQLRVVYLSPQAEQVTGVPVAQFLGKTNREVGLPDDLCAKWDEGIASVFRNGKPCTLEFDFPAPNGLRTFLLRLAPEHPSPASVDYVLGVSTEITDRKQAEAALSAQTEELRRSQQAALDLARDATTARRQAEEVAEALRHRTAALARSNEDLQQFVYAASHDLQEPLRMVSGFLTLLKERYAPHLDGKAREYIDFSVEGATRLSHLVSDLLDFSRVTSRGPLLEKMDSGQAAEAAIANLHAAIEETGAVIAHDELPVVLGDATQLMQLFQNLIGNAIKFRSPDRPCRIQLSARKTDGHWTFAIQDNGIGIPSDAFARIFVIFQRLHTREEYSGTGIGLAVCKKIVERHGGSIWVESVEGRGTTMFFTLRDAVG